MDEITLNHTERPAEKSPAPTAVRTQKELARLAGVSLNTVYNAIHKRELVQEATRERIYRLMREYDYHPDGIAQSMVRGKTDVLGLVVPNLEVSYYARLVSGIERYANTRGYHCIICQHLDDPSKEEREVTMMRQRRVDGIVLHNCGRDTDNDVIGRLARANIPLVLMNGRTQGLDDYFVGTDDRLGAYQAVGYLIQKGHRRIAHIGWHRTGIFQNSPRTRGYFEALTQHGIEVDPNLLEMGETEYTSGRREILNILRRNAAHPPTAVFAFNDNAGIGVLAGLKEAGVEVPARIAVISFGGYIDMSLLPTSLTTVEEDLEEISKRACQMLICQIENQPWERGPILVPGRLRVGQSG